MFDMYSRWTESNSTWNIPMETLVKVTGSDPANCGFLDFSLSNIDNYAIELKF